MSALYRASRKSRQGRFLEVPYEGSAMAERRRCRRSRIGGADQTPQNKSSVQFALFVML